MYQVKGEWRKLVMVNYKVPGELLKRYIPHGTSLCSYNGQHFITLAGFMFENVKVMGVKIPFNHTFEEINLRFYVEKDDTGEKGVVFINETVKKRLFGTAVRLFSQENYTIHPTGHNFVCNDDEMSISYKWKHKDWFMLRVTVKNAPRPFAPGTEEEFILYKHWSFTRICPQLTSPFFVDHPEWKVYPLDDYEIRVNFKKMYGKKFDFLNYDSPHSVYVAEGSPIRMKKMKNF